MSKKQKNETSAKAPVKLTRAEKKEIQAVIRKYKGDGKPHSAQASIPYEAMYQDGVCRVTPRTFSKCIEFTDISYQLAQADTKTAIFENLCDLYNYLDASIHVQFSFINRKIDPKQYAKSFEIRAQGDDFDDIRSEYSDILQDQLVNGNNGLMKRKFMTYTIEADSLKMARARLRRIETDLLGYFKSMGASAWGLDAKERLEVMHSIFHPDGEPFSFDWKWLAPSGLSTKDFIAPSSFRFGNARMFGLGGKYGAVSFLQILSPELSDEMLADFLNTENGIVVNLHVQAIDQSDAIKTVKRKITDLDAMKIRTFTVTLAAVLCLTAFSTTAFAGGTDPNPEPLPETTEAPQEEEPTTGGMEPKGVPVTPEGNATLVDDFYGDKQLITVTTKAGNYFYILIDRANEDKETAVHFLNQVDDADLQALLEDGKAAPETCTCTTKCAAGAVNTNCPVCKTNMTECTGPEPEPQEPEETEQPQEDEAKGSGMGGLVVFLVVALIGGGAALYFFKFKKPKADTKGGDELDEYDFGEDEDDEDEPTPEDEEPAQDKEE